MLDERHLDKGKIVRLKEQNALLLQRVFGRKSEQTTDTATPQLALFNEVGSVDEPVDVASDEEAVARSSAAANARDCLPICRASRSSTNFPSMS